MITLHTSPSFTFSAVSAGLFTSEDIWIHPRRQIDSYEIIYMLAGNAFLQEEEEQFHLTKGDLFLLYPDRLHFGYQISRETVSFYWFHFNVSDFSALGIRQQHLSPSGDHRMNLLAKQLLHISNTEGYPPYAKDTAMLMIANEYSVIQENGGAEDKSIFREITEWIQMNLSRNISVQLLADALGYNSEYLSSLFKSKYGIGLKQYINQRKIKLIQNYLLTSTYSMKQVAQLTGFDDANQFINFFKYHEGVSPAKYRNLYFNTHRNNH